jgi:mono/diheme cytochrome c family protein
MKQSLLLVTGLCLFLTGCSGSKSGELSFGLTKPGSNSQEQLGETANNQAQLAAERAKILQRQKEKEADWKELVAFAQDSFMQVQPIFKSSCYSCHDQETPLPFYGKPFPDKNSIKKHRDDGLDALDFSTQFPLKAKGDPAQAVLLKSIKSAVLDRTMPLKIYTTLLPWKRLTKKEQRKIVAWIDPLLVELEKFEAKYADNEDTSLKGQVYRIFEAKCFQCHANGNRRGGYGGMENLDSVLTSAFVNSQDPSSSKLLGLLARTQEPAMPPSARMTLTPEEVDLIRDWLEESFSQ